MGDDEFNALNPFEKEVDESDDFTTNALRSTAQRLVERLVTGIDYEGGLKDLVDLTFPEEGAQIIMAFVRDAKVTVSVG